MKHGKVTVSGGDTNAEEIVNTIFQTTYWFYFASEQREISKHRNCAVFAVTEENET